MNRNVSATQFVREFAKWQIEAHKAPVTLTRRGCPNLVLLSEEDFEELKRRAGIRVVRAGRTPDDDLAAIRAAQPTARAHEHDEELEDHVPA